MPLVHVSGDPLLTTAQVLLIGHNQQGRTEMNDLTLRLSYHAPAAFAAYQKLCRQDRLSTGDLWLWRESRPVLMFGVVRASAVGATRLRYVQAVVMRFAREYRLEGITSLAVAPLGTALEQPDILPILTQWLARLTLPVQVYDTVVPGKRIDPAVPPTA